MAPNSIGFVYFVFIEPFKAHQFHCTNRKGILDSSGVGSACVFKFNLGVILHQASVVVGAVDVAVKRL